MYNEHRTSTKQVIITSVAWLGGIAALVLLVGWLIGALIKAPESTIVADAPVRAPVMRPVTETVEPAPRAEPVPIPKTEADMPQVVPAVPVETSVTGNATGVVVIDAGHQAKANLAKEPVGPGSSQTKYKVTGGATGVSTGNLESQINLVVARKLRDRLKAAGVKVVMVRDSQDVNIPNSERAKVGNRAKADLTIRIHCNGVDNRSTSGLLTIYPEKNRWTGAIIAPSKKAALAVHKATLAATGARNAGVTTPPVTMTGFNWSTVPTVIVEMGFMSNPDEDRKLGSGAYQDKLAKGMASGILDYLSSK